MNEESDYLKKMTETQFVVEATWDEVYMLWGKYSNQSFYKTDLNSWNWEDSNPGWCVEVGKMGEFLVIVSMQWNRINGVLVLFYEGISRVVDHEMIEEWLKARCAPRWDKGSRLAYTNAANFHNVLTYVLQSNRR